MPLGTRGHNFTVVGLMRERGYVIRRSVAYITLRDAQALQLNRASGFAARDARGGTAANQRPDQCGHRQSVALRPDRGGGDGAVAMEASDDAHAGTAGNPAEQVRHREGAQAAALIMVLLVIVSAVIIALIIYTLTMDKVRSIATLKFVGAPDRTIVGLIVQQALSMGIFGYFAGLALVLIFKPYFPRRLVLDPESSRCVRHHDRGLPVASTLGIRLALKVDPAAALSASG